MATSRLALAAAVAMSVAVVAMSPVPVSAGPKMTDLILDACEREGGPIDEDYQKVHPPAARRRAALPAEIAARDTAGGPSPRAGARRWAGR